MNSISHQNTCVCCLERNVSLYKLSTCKYADFFQTFFKLKMQFTKYLICYHCHNLLKKMELFRQQVTESVAILSGQSVNLTATRKINSLICSKLEISSMPNWTNCKPITFKIKDDPTRHSPDIKAEVKMEYEPPDVGADDIPLSVLKKDNVETSKASKSKKISPLQKKYDGKIRLIIMSNEEMMQEREKESLKERYLNLPYKCESCIIGFDHESTLQDHIKKRHNTKNGDYVCDICKSVLGSERSYTKHTKGHVRSYECEVCGQRNNNIRTLVKHYNDNHSDGFTTEFDCKECGCGSKFRTKTALREHIDWIHLKNTKYKCTKCSKIFKNNAGLKKHNNYVHEKIRPPRNKICDHCGRGFTTLTILRSHIRTHTGERPLRCAHCPATFAHPAALYTHNKLLHTQP